MEPLDAKLTSKKGRAHNPTCLAGSQSNMPGELTCQTFYCKENVRPWLMKHANSVLEVEIGRKSSKSWCVLVLCRTPTSVAIFELAFARIYRPFPDIKRNGVDPQQERS
jgi:hypothetical protein